MGFPITHCSPNNFTHFVSLWQTAVGYIILDYIFTSQMSLPGMVCLVENQSVSFPFLPLLSSSLFVCRACGSGYSMLAPWLLHMLFIKLSPPPLWVEKVGPYRPCPNNTPCSLGLVCLFWSTHPHYGVCIIPCLSPDCVHSVHPCLPCLKSREVLCCICCLHSGHHC